jgi:hypothetical protein
MKDKNIIDKVLSSNYKQKILSRPQAKDFANPSELKDEDLRAKELLNEITESELKLKKGICVWVKWVVSIYLIFIACILLLLVLSEGKLESSVVIALLSTTTINILGLPYMIIKSLFPEKKN